MSHIRMQRHLREKLIEQVQKHPILYNTNHENHRDNDLRDCAWNQISELLGVNSDTLKREWKILRDSLRQALKKQKQKPGTGNKGSKWYFESKMSFLFPFMTKRKIYTRVPKSSTLDELKMDSAEVEWEEGEPLEAPGREPWGQEPGREPWGPEPADPLELFFASVCQSTRKLPRKVQGQVKRQILDVLLKAEEESEDSKSAVCTDYVT